MFLHTNKQHLAADTWVPEETTWLLVLSQAEGRAACWTLSFEVACAFLNARKRDADMVFACQLAATINSWMSQKGLRLIKEYGWGEILILSQVLLDSRVTEYWRQSFLCILWYDLIIGYRGNNATNHLTMKNNGCVQNSLPVQGTSTICTVCIYSEMKMR